ncbi:hypothetical protein ACFQGB_06570 [Halorubellus litoreus]|uniref:Uncharacterized protein n=1 Tax=Halorubellus litoreus TaxID=755308 RepID=A0ABD5VCB1_9EURY
MRDRVCPIEECAATVRFDAVVVEVTPRYRLHDLGEVDEFATCPECDAEVAGYYPEEEDDDGDVELILDIDDEDDSGDDDADATADERGAAGGGFDAATDAFDDPDDVLDEAAGDGDSDEASDGDDGDAGDDDLVFG